MEVNMELRKFQFLSSKSAKSIGLSLPLVAALTLGSLALGPSTILYSAQAAPAAPAKATDKAADKKETTKPAPEPVIENIVNVQPETLVDHPNEYLNKNIRFNAQFYGYNSLAVDYKPAMRSSKQYISFSVLRDHSKVPLSELKLAMVNPKDEKDELTKLLIKLKEKDEIEVIGKVFNTALDEPWVDVLKLKLIKAAPDDKKPEAGSTPAK